MRSAHKLGLVQQHRPSVQELAWQRFLSGQVSCSKETVEIILSPVLHDEPAPYTHKVDTAA